MKKAISVLSGGLDCTVATSVYSKDYEIHAITFNYGQKAFQREVKAAKEICKKMNWTHEVIDLPWLSKISTSSLNTSEEIPEVSLDDLDDPDKSSETASSVWVPARNTVFTSIALSYAESIGAEIIIVGWDAEEAATFPDNSKEYLEKFNELIGVGSPDNIKIEAPAIDLDKEEIVKLGVEVGAPMELSYSCYKGSDKHCGVCESCMRRKRAFKKLNIEDLSEYEN
ncbi:MAG: 7-cyano-7-deazaguanine synthase QueC [Methanobrevibacter sp.]|jgi:7-cyano-7-deazaguanine synthase|uniref:7-cyano-7-deazaguanine synthase QueC n=1 Tax=Methanobrevibacter sp. TaxID=66852 RepID=UPI0025FEB11F|nr:7-cyano-7-deazaguanine synthase QueC [Methanobrevibacter sp.]MBE6497937.1 7-cyano-7-deazaguanine synthase QueC [Methanobrevibacter sp.]